MQQQLDNGTDDAFDYMSLMDAQYTQYYALTSIPPYDAAAAGMDPAMASMMIQVLLGAWMRHEFYWLCEHSKKRHDQFLCENDEFTRCVQCASTWFQNPQRRAKRSRNSHCTHRGHCVRPICSRVLLVAPALHCGLCSLPPRSLLFGLG